MSKKSTSVTRGNVTIPINPHPVKDKTGKVRHYFRLRYHQDGKLHRPTFADLKAATAAATVKAIEIANGRTIAQQLTPEDVASIARARQILASHKVTKPIETVALEYAEAVSKLSTTNTQLPTAVDYYVHHHPAKPWPLVPDVISEFLKQKQLDGTGWRQRRDLKVRLNVLGKEFNCPLATVTAVQIAGVLDKLQGENEWGNRSRNHYRAAFSNMAGFARRKKMVPKDWNELPDVEKFQEKDGPVIIWTPEEAEKLFKAALKYRPQQLPGFVLMFFVGNRHSEVQGTVEDEVTPIDWSELNLDEGTGFLEVGKVRRAGNRITYIPPNAAAWLRPFRQTKGPVCPFKNLTNDMVYVAKKAGLKWKQNAARRSYISYRLAQTKDIAAVSEETGTSVPTLQRRYRRPIPLTEAEKYFNILPPAELIGRQYRFERQKRAKNVGTFKKGHQYIPR